MGAPRDVEGKRRYWRARGPSALRSLGQSGQVHARGPWIDAYRNGERLDGNVVTIGLNNANFVPTRWSDAATLFCESGHTLHHQTGSASSWAISVTQLRTEWQPMTLGAQCWTRVGLRICASTTAQVAKWPQNALLAANSDSITATACAVRRSPGPRSSRPAAAMLRIREPPRPISWRSGIGAVRPTTATVSRSAQGDAGRHARHGLGNGQIQSIDPTGHGAWPLGQDRKVTILDQFRDCG